MQLPKHLKLLMLMASQYEPEITKGKDSFDLLFDSSFKYVKKGHF